MIKNEDINQTFDLIKFYLFLQLVVKFFFYFFHPKFAKQDQLLVQKEFLRISLKNINLTKN